MSKRMSFAAIAAVAFAAPLFQVATVSAQSANERTGIVIKSTTPPDPTKTFLCSLPGKKAVYPCNAAEFKKNPGYRVNEAKADAERRRQAQIKKDMEAEARSLKKIQDERKRSAPTTEHCLMKNGTLVCKPI